jgi:hypothetical protein
MYKVSRKLCAVSGNTAAFFRLFTGKNYIQVGAGLVAVRTRLEALLNPSTVLAEVVFAGSWFQSLMVLGKNKLPKASLLVLS